MPFRLYAGDPNWVPPLRRAQAKLFAGKTAFSGNADMALFLAERAGTPVARVAAIHNRAHNAHYGDRTGFFGFFECQGDDAEAARGLFARAEEWLARRGLETIRGPVNPSMNAECGLLVRGFDKQPVALMPYNPESYIGLVESWGFRKCKDLFAYLLHTDRVGSGTKVRDRIRRVAEAAKRRHGEVTVRRIDMRRFRQEVLRFMAVFEEARRHNWGYVPLSEKEVLEVAGGLKSVVDPEIIVLAEVSGELAGVALAIPDVNRGLAASNGRLTPFGLLRFRRAMRRVTVLRILGIAALAKYRHLGITVMLFLELILRGTARGYRHGEASWILEDNIMSNRTIQQVLDPDGYKMYRVYEKPIGEVAGT